MAKTRMFAVIVAAVLVIAGVVAYVVTRPDTSPAPATKQAIAAVAIGVLEIEPSSYDVNPRYDVPLPLGVEIRWHPGGSQDAHRLLAAVEEGPEEPLECGDAPDCVTWEDHGGRFRLNWQEWTPEEDPGILVLQFRIDGENRLITYAGKELEGDPREQENLPVSIDRFVDLLTDDRFSRTTTQEMVDADLAKWPKDADAGDPVTTTPQVVAQWMRVTIGEPPTAVPVNTSAYGPDAVGAEFRFKNRTTTVVIVPDDAPTVPTCEQGWHCSKPKDHYALDYRVTTGWQPGEVRILLTYDDRTVLATVRSDMIDKFPEPAWKYKGVGSDVEGFSRSVSAWSLTTTKKVADGSEKLPWFEE